MSDQKRNIKLDGPSEVALSNLQDTKLSPMEEALFRAWTKANQIHKPDAADDYTDYRGIFKQTGGKVMPFGQLPQLAKEEHSRQLIKRRLMDTLGEGGGENPMLKEQESIRKQQDMSAKHQMQMEAQQEKRKNLMLQREVKEPGPNQLRSQELDNEGKSIDLQKVLISRAVGGNDA